MRKNLMMVLAVTAALMVGGVSRAVADGLITSKQIQDHTIKVKDLRPGTVNKLKGQTGATGTSGKDGKDGKDATFGAVYRVAHYTNGGGGRATVACADDAAVSQTYTAIAGGAQSESVLGGTTDTQPITSSFPGRMDWSTNTAKPNRLDGWIVNFGSGAAPTAGSGVLDIWALCVPTVSITKQVTNY